MQSDFLWGYALLSLAKMSLEKQLHWIEQQLASRGENRMRNMKVTIDQDFIRLQYLFPTTFSVH